jgi:hypothetical protein
MIDGELPMCEEPSQPRLWSCRQPIHSEAIMTRQSIGPRSIRRLARVWADMNYAQQRLFEVQTGIRVIGRPND